MFLIVCLFFFSALAQTTWPTKPVRIVVPFAPGGTTDILARALAPEWSKAFGQSFVVENRADARGHLGADAVAELINASVKLINASVKLLFMCPRSRWHLLWCSAAAFR